MADFGEPMTTWRLPSSSGGTWDVLPRMVGRTSMPSAAKRPFSIAAQSGTLKNVRDTRPTDIFSSISETSRLNWLLQSARGMHNRQSVEAA